MTIDEMQRFIDLGIEEKKTEIQIFRDLREVLGLKYEPQDIESSVEHTK